MKKKCVVSFCTLVIAYADYAKCILKFFLRFLLKLLGNDEKIVLGRHFYRIMTSCCMFSKTSSTPQSNKPLKRYIPESATGGVL